MKNGKIFSILIVVLSIGLTVSLFLFPDIFKDHKNWGIIGIFITNFISGLSFFPAPSFITAVVGGSIYPPILVGLAASLGATLGDMLYLILGISGRKIAKKKLEKSKWFSLIEKNFQKYGGWILFAGAFIPNPIFDSFGLIAGIFNFSILRFFAIIMAGRFLRYFVLAQIGARFY
ncbi:VTT domain-containing protein [Patescibacteria group bacterium]|nr:VTT domain-containing protein [Patescibacteria group bacterium]